MYVYSRGGCAQVWSFEGQRLVFSNFFHLVRHLWGARSWGVRGGDFLDVRVRFGAFLEAERLVEGASQLKGINKDLEFKFEITHRRKKNKQLINSIHEQNQKDTEDCAQRIKQKPNILHYTKFCITVASQVLGSHPAFLLLFLGILVLHAAHTGHTSQTVEAGDALARVLPLNSQVWESRATNVKRGKMAKNAKGHPVIVWPFMFSGVFKAPCMTACASSFLVLRASMVSLSSTSSVSYQHMMES